MTARIASLFPDATEPPRVTRPLLPGSTSSQEIDRAVRTRARERRALYGLDANRLAEAAPDLIITQRLCGVCAVSEVGAAPEVLFVACCGYDVTRTLQDLPLLAARAGWDALPAVRARRVHVADGTRFFARPGPALVEGLEMLAHAIDPDAHPLPAEAAAAARVQAQDLRRMLAPASHQ